MLSLLCTCPSLQTVFMNEDYVTPQPLPIEDTQPTASVDRQSDCGVVSPDTSSPARQAVSPETTQEVKEDALKTITMETVYALIAIACEREGSICLAQDSNPRLLDLIQELDIG